MSNAIIDLCDIKDINNKKIDINNCDKGYALVGYNLKDEYPLGSIYHDNQTETDYIISDIMKKNQYWIPNDILSSDAINIDNTIILDSDYLLFL